MALQKQSVPLNFSKGMDTKTDPFQVGVGSFSTLQNMVFTKGGMLSKRNGYAAITPLPDDTSTFATTFNGGLTAIGQSIFAYSTSSETWGNKGSLQPIDINTLPLIRSNTNQSQADSAVSDTGVVCTVFTDDTPSGIFYKYVVSDADTGQNIIPPTLIPAGAGVIMGSPGVFLLGRYFIIVITNLIAGVYRLQYIAINVLTPSSVNPAVDISFQYDPTSDKAWDGFVNGNLLYLAWNGNDAGGAIRCRKLDVNLALYAPHVISGFSADILSVCVDDTGVSDIAYVSFYDSGTLDGYTSIRDQNYNQLVAPVQIINNEVVLNLTSSAQNSLMSFFYEIDNAYSYDAAVKTNYINTNTLTELGVLGSPSVLIRSVGLASKSFLQNGDILMLTLYFSDFQPTYFLVDSLGEIIAKFAYENGPPYYSLGLPTVSLNDSVAQVPYLFKDVIIPINKDQGIPNSAGVYSQTGINLISFDFTPANPTTAEIGASLQISGGFLWMYDGYVAVEQGFFVWPDNVEVSTSTSGGSLSAQQYFYQVLYEWTDAQGMIHRSAPSIPVSVTTTGSTSSNTINVPTLRLTYKTANPVKIVIFRWSTAQQTYYQVTSILDPLLNDPTVDDLAFVDILADADILGNSIIYITGGVVEDIAPPATSVMTLFKSRLFLVDSEDRNLLWYSKQVIEATPVEMSDLFTVYIAPTTSAQGATGPITALSAMDDKLVIFKKDAIYYITGDGPDNTGANNNFSEPVFITSTVGCANPQSIVFSPRGLMFQSDKGIWLLGRDLSTSYIGADVEAFNASLVQSAVNVPATNQVRFTLDSGQTLMYDYYYSQWGTFVGVPAISSTLFQGMHTYINSFGQAFQEEAGFYLDGSHPVLLSFTTGWINVAGIQGFLRAYQLYLLGVYYSPHKLNVAIAYDYNPSPMQTSMITPNNFVNPWGGEQLWGSGDAWGGPGNIEQWRVFLSFQKCEALQISVTEIYDATKDQAAGAGFTLSGMNLVVGMKSSYPRLKASVQVG